MPIGYIVVSTDGHPAPFFRSAGPLSDYRYETKLLPCETTRLSGEIKYGYGRQGYRYANSRAWAVAHADETCSVLLTVEGEGEDEAFPIVACRQLTVLEATACFCHPAQLKHAQAMMLAASIARVVSVYCDDALVIAAIEATEAHSLTGLDSSRALAGQAAEALMQRSGEEPWLAGPKGIGVARHAAMAARTAAMAATTMMTGEKSWIAEASLAASLIEVDLGEEGWMAERWAFAAARQSNFAVEYASRVSSGATSSAALRRQREAGEMVWNQYATWGDMLFDGMPVEEFIATRRTSDELLKVLKPTED